MWVDQYTWRNTPRGGKPILQQKQLFRMNVTYNLLEEFKAF